MFVNLKALPSLSTSCSHSGQFSACLADVNVWLSASTLRFNVSKTQMLWIGSTQLLDRITCQDVLVLSTRVAFSDTARDHAGCHWRSTAGRGIYLGSPGLLQFTAVRHQGQATAPCAVGAEHSYTPGHWRSTVQSCHICATAAALAACLPVNYFQDRRGPPFANWHSACIHH